MSIFRKNRIEPKHRLTPALYTFNAMVCLECEHIFPASLTGGGLSGTCPKCTSTAVPLSQWFPVEGGGFKVHMMETQMREEAACV